MRDPKRDQAFEIYIASGGKINLNVIAAQLGVGDGTLRGWKAKDEWDKNLNPSQESETPKQSKKKIKVEQTHDSEDELYEQAVEIVKQAKQASCSLIQRRLRIGYTRSARLIEDMERNGLVGPYRGSNPREVYINERKETKPEKKNAPIEKERNAPLKASERSINKERSDKRKNELIEIDDVEKDEADDDGLTPIFITNQRRRKQKD